MNILKNNVTGYILQFTRCFTRSNASVGSKNMILGAFCIFLAACSTAQPLNSGSATPSLTETVNAPSQSAHSGNYITRTGSKLYDGDDEFRFLSVNIPTLWYIEDDWSFEQEDPYRLPTEFEIRDVLGAVEQMGGSVVRGYTIPVRNTDYPKGSVTFVEAPGVFNEEAFRTMDLAVAVAGEKGLRLIIPLVNNWPWHGGRPNYAAFRGKGTDAFCTDPQIREDFKKTIRFVLNRRNTITGIRYNEDPTIMAWETGNEMTCPSEWAVDIARTLKSEAPRQLVVDGWHAVHMIFEGKPLNDYPLSHAVEEPAIDLVSTHHYEEDPAAMIRNISETVRRIDGKKAVFPGEFGFISPAGFEKVFDYIISEPDIPGGLVWSLRRHNEKGGWLHHSEPLGAGLYRAYHWPGFDDGEPFGEREFLTLLRGKAHEIRGINTPPLSAPKAPELLAFTQPGQINWKGSVGASSYTIERSSTGNGGWSVIASNIDDIDTPGFPLFSDTGATIGEPNYYRIIAHNAAGSSGYSNVVGPIIPSRLTLVDRTRGFGVAARWKDIAVKSGNFAEFKEAFSRLSGTDGSELVYTVSGQVKEVRIYSYEAGDTEALRISSSNVKEQYESGSTSVKQHVNHRGRHPRFYRYIPSQGASHDYVKLDFAASADIVRVEIDYRD